MAVPGRTESLRRVLLARALAAGLGLVLGTAAADTPGRFDYWVLSLSWSPQFCRNEPGNAQCQLPRGFVVHGLWPQYEEDGYPDYCGERERVPDELVDRMLPLMPDVKLIQQQWRKHGSCSGMDIGEYFLNVERAWRRVVIPPEFAPDRDAYESSLQAIEKAFIGANPGFDRDGIALQCGGGRWLREVRMCFDRDFQPRACGEDVVDQCRNKINVRPVRAKPQPLF